jgi:hypothetical protein
MKDFCSGPIISLNSFFVVPFSTNMLSGFFYGLNDQAHLPL